MRIAPTAATAAAALLLLTSFDATGQTAPASGPSATTIGAGSSSAGSATGGTAGSAAAGGTSASTIGAGATSTGPAGSSQAIGGAGSAATVDGGKATSSNKIHENPNMLHDQAKARAQDGGTWSRSSTDTKVRDGEVTSTTKSMAHEPGGPPAKSRTTETVPAQR